MITENMQYNDDIILIRKLNEELPRLSRDQFYALMVEDNYNKYRRAKQDYFDYDTGSIGLEKTTEGRIYISKEFHKRKNLGRGSTYLVEVKGMSNTCMI